MMALFVRLLLLAVFISATTAVIQTSDGFTECRVPDNNSSIHHVHTNFSEEEFDLLQIEGLCFLFCTTEIYSIEIGDSNYIYSLSSYWPFISINQSDCMITFEVHECTRGCLYRHMHRNTSDLRDCTESCQNTCNSVLELQSCDRLFECHPWIPVEECEETCDQLIHPSYPKHPCLEGCRVGDLQNGRCCSESAPPCDPIGPPLLILDRNTTEQLKFIIDLSGATPQAQECEPISTSMDILPVAFLFKFVEINSGNVSYKWTANPFEHLDLIEYACQELMVSFAVNNRAGISEFSPAISVIINGDEQLTPIPPTGLQISEEIDKRCGFFGHVILNISWDNPQLQNDTYQDYFLVTLTTAAGFDKLMCGRPWIRRVPILLCDRTSLVIEAESKEALPVMSCSYDIQIHSIGCYGASHPLQETYAINTEFDTRSIGFECQRWWRTANVNERISFNLTWILPPFISKGHVISNFIVDFKLLNTITDITIPMGSITVTFRELFQERSAIFIKNLNFITNLNMTFLSALLFDNSWLYHLETQVIWNNSSIPHKFMPPNNTYTCVESTLYPNPGPVEDLIVASCTTNGSYVTLNLEWSPPSSAITVEIDSYNICTGVSLESDLEMSPLNRGNRRQCSKFNFINGINQTAIVYHPKASTDLNEPLYVQIRAHTLYTTGNWSELQYDLPMCHQEVDNSYIVGIIIGVSLISLAALICLGPSVCIIRMIQQRRKLYRTIQRPHDPIFSGRVGRFQLERSIITFPTRKPDKWEIPSKEIVVKELLGEGIFGEVYMGIIKCPIISPQRRASMHKSIFTSVAIKLLKSSSGGNERQDFLSEIEMMKKVAEGQNAHVVSLLGCVTIQEPLCLITEFVKYGDLLKYLRTNRRMCTGSNTEDDENDDAYVELGGVTSVDLISFAYQITSEMEYLSSLGIVHRDLACRNILVDEGKVLKITDFGLSRETDEIYVQKRTGRVPLKWMAIESIIAREFTSASDVWSFGVVLWEIGTLGGLPYPSIQNDQLLSILNRGYRMDKPDNCSPEVYDIMLICWNEQPKERPTFKELRAKFDTMLLAEKNDTYIALCIDENKSYYPEIQTPVATKDEDSDRKSACSQKDGSMLDKKFSARKLIDSRSGQSSVSLDEFRMVDQSQGMELRSPGNLPVSLSLQLITEDQKGQSESRYVESPMKRLLAATPPAGNLVESRSEIEMKSTCICEQSNPNIKISFAEHQN